MKRTLHLGITTILAATILLQTSCFGSFKLTSSIYDFNSGVRSGVGQQLVFYILVLVPIYGIGGFLDLFLLNPIEFWFSENIEDWPEGKTEEMVASHKGKTYVFTKSKNGIAVEVLKNEVIQEQFALQYNPATEEILVSKNGSTFEHFASFNATTQSVTVYQENVPVQEHDLGSLFQANRLLKTANRNLLTVGS